jgi:hypothetical protein
MPKNDIIVSTTHPPPLPAPPTPGQHPYDVGDRVFIDEENLVVQSVEFSRTTFDVCLC